jgi:peptide-methionine (S)-S-oxide reductase
MPNSSKLRIPDPGDALPGRETAIAHADRHSVLDAPLAAELPNTERIDFGMGCFWGAERLFWTLEGVVSTAVGYAGGFTPNPSYQEVCSGRTGHNEVVRVHYRSTELPLEKLLERFWQEHDPTQGMRQGNDRGTQYRSSIFCSTQSQLEQVEGSRLAYQKDLTRAGRGAITTEICMAPPFYFAEDYHQQYLAKNPSGYCGLRGTGVACSSGLG